MSQSFSINCMILRKVRLSCLIGIMLFTPDLGGVLLAKQASQHSDAATITFTLDFPHSDPEHYTISVENSGHSHYESLAAAAPDSAAQSYASDFEVSPDGRDKIFQWAKQAKYFSGNIDSGNRKLAFTGNKVVSYHDQATNNTAHYVNATLPPVRELTAFFQGMAATLEYGRRLDYYHHYQKLALDDELKRMVSQAANNELSEIHSIAPVLRQIVDDSSVMNVDRARARDLLQSANGTSAHN